MATLDPLPLPVVLSLQKFSILSKTHWFQWRIIKNPELTMIQRTQVIVLVTFTNHWAITIIWKNIGVFKSFLSSKKKTHWFQWRIIKNPELTLIQRTQVVVFVTFTNNWAITIIWKNKKVTLPVVQNNMVIQCAEIPPITFYRTRAL